MSDTFATALVAGIPAIITSIAGAWVVIRQTNKKTEREAKVTNDKVDEVQKGVNGNIEQFNKRLDTQTDKIDELHKKIEVTAVQTEVDKAAALNANRLGT
jgi:hypothetical protein